MQLKLFLLFVASCKPYPFMLIIRSGSVLEGPQPHPTVRAQCVSVITSSIEIAL